LSAAERCGAVVEMKIEVRNRRRRKGLEGRVEADGVFMVGEGNPG
jgi:hypothetical protein